jgi:hypothetical protein
MVDDWIPLLSLTRNDRLSRGALLKFPAVYLFEDRVVLMLCESRGQPEFPYNLVTIAGYKAGISPLQNLPKKCRQDEIGFDVAWLRRNWNKWVYPECNVDDVLVRTEPLRVDEVLSPTI